MRNAGLTTRNQTLEKWWPAISNLDQLLDHPEVDKVKTYTEENFALRVAYQSPAQVTFKGQTTEALSYTLEDSLVLSNVELFETLEGEGLIAKFRKAIADSASVDALSAALKDALKTGNKAEFAMDLLEINEASSLKPPGYIREGLLWLAEQLKNKQVELGLAQPTELPPAEPVAVAGGALA